MTDLGTAATADTGDFASAAQGALAASAVQPSDTASTTAAGVVELATVAEAEAGTDTTRAVTPQGVAAAISALSGGAGLSLPTNGARVALINGSGGVALQGGGWCNSVMINVPVDITATSITINVTSAGASPSDVHIGLYSFTTPGGTGTLVHDFGSVDTTTTGGKTLTGTWSIPAGMYYITALMVGNTCTVTGAGTLRGFADLIVIPGESEPGKRYLSNSGSSSLPASLTSPSANGAVGSNAVPRYLIGLQ